MNEVLYGFDYLTYYFYLLYYKFVGYPFVVRLCVSIVLICTLLYLFLMLYLVYGIYRRKKAKRINRKIVDRYYETTRQICLDPNRQTEEEITETLRYDLKKPLKRTELRFFIRMLSQIKSEEGKAVNEFNFQSIQSVFRITRFFEREIQFGSNNNKVQALLAIQSINGYVSEAVLVRFLYHRKVELRYAARFTYMWLSQNNPFRFFDEDVSMKLQLWNMAELHSILLHRRQLGFVTPNFIKWVNTSLEDNVRIFFVREIGYFEETENCPALQEILNTRNRRLRNEIIRTLGALQYREAEPTFFEMYDVQSEPIKQSIVAAVSEMKSGQGISFLQTAYETADDQMLKLSILKGLYEYGDAGRSVFRKLETAAEGFARQLFAHVQNPLTNRV